MILINHLVYLYYVNLLHELFKLLWYIIRVVTDCLQRAVDE